MTEFTFPASLTEIGQGAFVSTGFKTIEIPATVISIGYSAFGFTTDQTHEIIAVDGFFYQRIFRFIRPVLLY